MEGEGMGSILGNGGIVIYVAKYLWALRRSDCLYLNSCIEIVKIHVHISNIHLLKQSIKKKSNADLLTLDMAVKMCSKFHGNYIYFIFFFSHYAGKHFREKYHQSLHGECKLIMRSLHENVLDICSTHLVLCGNWINKVSLSYKLLLSCPFTACSACFLWNELTSDCFGGMKTITHSPAFCSFYKLNYKVRDNKHNITQNISE